MNGGSCSSYTNSYTIETNTFSLCTPTRNGYTFAGWTGSNGTTKQTSVSIAKGSTGNKSYTANWTPVNYSISYTLNSGSVSGNPTSYNIETNTITLKNPTRNGYTFTGWTGSNGTTKQTTVTIPKGSTGNKSYTANWTPTNYSISYTLNSGSVSGNPTSYNIETNAITLNNPTRYGYNFTGWSGTGLSGSTNKTVTIPKGSTGNRSYTANWQATLLAISNMQQMTSSICSATAISVSNDLIDTRDNHVYTVTKLKDGKCWMTQDLTISGITITNSDSDVSSSFEIPTSLQGGFSGYDANAVYTNGYRAWYSFYAATAGTGTYNYYRDYGGSPIDTPSSICPRGWRLPTGNGDSNEFKTLYNSYGLHDLMYDEPNLNTAGYMWSNSFYGAGGSQGGFWSSTQVGFDQAVSLFSDGNYELEPDYRTWAHNGLHVRCVAK